MSHPIKSALILFFSILMLVAQHPVNGLKENEEVTDDFDTGTADFWQWTPGDTEENSTTIWHLSKHGDPPPFGIDAVRPPMEDDGGGYLEIVPFSDSPAQILSNVFDLLPYATVEMTYWNVVPIPVQGRNTVLILYLEFQNVTLNDETGIEPLRTVMVFKAPTPTDPSPGWTTATVDLPITEPCQVQVNFYTSIVTFVIQLAEIYEILSYIIMHSSALMAREQICPPLDWLLARLPSRTVWT